MQRPQPRIGLTVATTLVALEVALLSFLIVAAADFICGDHPQDGCAQARDGHWALDLSAAGNIAIYALMLIDVALVLRGAQVARQMGGWAQFVVYAITANVFAIFGPMVVLEAFVR